MIKILTLVAFLGGALFATDNLAINMAKSENGLSNIQKGFLYNSVALVKNGGAEVREANKMFHNMSETAKYLPKDKQHMKNIAFNAANRINSAVDEMEIHLAHNEMGKAQNAYSQIIGACASCHAVVRGW